MGCGACSYVVKECSYEGALNPELVVPRLMAHKEFLADQGIKNPMSLLGALKKGECIQLPDCTIEPQDVLGPDRPGRKLVVLGDTRDSSAIAAAACGCDVLVHEATNAFFPTVTLTLTQTPNVTLTIARQDDRKLVEQVQRALGVVPATEGEPSPPPSEQVLHLANEAVLAKTIQHGHSTPEMAGSFAHDIQAQVLVLTHFSARYKGDDSAESVARMEAIASQARAHFSGVVHTARDFWSLPLPVKQPTSGGCVVDLDQVALQAKQTANGFLERANHGQMHHSVIRELMESSSALKLHVHVHGSVAELVEESSTPEQ